MQKYEFSPLEWKFNLERIPISKWGSWMVVVARSQRRRRLTDGRTDGRPNRMTSGSHVVYQRNKRVNDNPNLPREDGLLRGRKTRSKSQMLPSAFPSASFHFDIFVRTPFCLFPKERARAQKGEQNKSNQSENACFLLSFPDPSFSRPERHFCMRIGGDEDFDRFFI